MQINEIEAVMDRPCSAAHASFRLGFSAACYRCSGVQSRWMSCGGEMKRRFLILTVLFLLFAPHVRADNQFIVRLDSGLLGIQPICIGLGCTVTRGLDGTLGELFLVNVPTSID